MAKRPPSSPIDDIRATVSHMLDELDPQMPIGATVVLVVNKSKEDRFLGNASQLTEATRRLPGVRIFKFHKHKSIVDRNDENPTYLIYEDWDSCEQFRVQWDSDHIKRFQYSVLELLAPGTQPDLRFYQGSGPEFGEEAAILKTGQAQCWKADGNVVACRGTGQDGSFKAGVAADGPRFQDNDDGTVTDNLTNLIWLKNANAFDEVPWGDALRRARELAAPECDLTDGSIAGDWRLPNVNELLSLVDLGNTTGGPSIAKGPFTHLEMANYWTSTTVASAPALGWFVAMAVTPHVFDLKVNSMRMWPVKGGLRSSARIARTGQTKCYDPNDPFGKEIPANGTGQDGEFQTGVPFPIRRFADNGDGTVTDQLTGLIWLKNANPFGVLSWQEALQKCNHLADPACDLDDGSKPGDWRLPNLNELRSLLDFSNFGPALTTGHPFEDVQSSLYWSSTTVASAPNQARFVFIGLGPSVWDHKSVQLNVWPVKGGI